MSETTKGFFSTLFETFSSGLPDTPDQYHSRKFGEKAPHYHTWLERRRILRQIEQATADYVKASKLHDPSAPIEGILLLGSFVHGNSHDGSGSEIKRSDIDYLTLASHIPTDDAEKTLARSLDQATRRSTQRQDTLLISELEERLPAFWNEIVYGAQVIIPDRRLQNSVQRQVKACRNKFGGLPE